MSNTVYNFLDVFYSATKKCSGVHYPTTQLVITHIYNIAHNFKDHWENPIFIDACAVIEIKFKKY